MSKRLFWIDLEMTGLDDQNDHILEVAIVITDIDFKPLEEYHRIVFQPPEILNRMDDFVRGLHTKSGLVQAIPNGVRLEQVEKEILELINRHYDKKDRIVLAGNSVGNDKRFVDRYLLQVAQRLHYRLIDVSSYKEIFRDKYQVSFQKQNTHRALEDIHESIRELSHYLSFVQVPEKK